MINALLFAVVSIPNTIASECECPIFVRVKGRDDAFYLEVSSSATVADLIQKMCNESIIPNTVDQEDLIINTPHGTLYGWGEDLTRSLAEVAVSAESVVSIDWLILDDLNDIQLLFHLFRDPRHTKIALGYISYNAFKIDHESFESQRQWLSTGSQMSIILSQGTFTVQQIDAYDLTGDIGTSYINWDVVSKLKALTYLDLSNASLKGFVPFDKLPQGLKTLVLDYNEFTDTRAPGNCTATLRHFSMLRNPSIQKLRKTDFPQISKWDYFAS